MSQQKLEEVRKVDLSFYGGYTTYRGEFRKVLLIHVFEMVMLSVFIPIDSTRLVMGNRMAASLAIALADAILSFLIMGLIYYKLFAQEGTMGYLALAFHTNHCTNKQIPNNINNIQELTSTTILYQPDGITSEDLDQNTINIYSLITKHEIQGAMNERHRNNSGFLNFYKFASLLAMILIIAFMIMSGNMNPAEIAILTTFLVLQAYLKLQLFVVLILMALSPVICIVAMIYCCFCVPKQQDQSNRRLNLASRSAETNDLVKSGGQCSVCLMEIKVGQQVYQLPCSDKHIFHQGCLQKWSMVQFTCPHCRAALPTKSLQQGQRQKQFQNVAQSS